MSTAGTVDIAAVRVMMLLHSTVRRSVISSDFWQLSVTRAIPIRVLARVGISAH
jgi:hypothetical protein